MALKTWTLTDGASDTYLDALRIGPDDVTTEHTGWSIMKRRLIGGRRDGVDVIEIDNGMMQFAVVPTRGMGVWRGQCGGDRIGWDSPIAGPINPAFVPLSEPSGLGWLDGFDELIARCGIYSNGAPEFDDHGTLMHPLHGRISNTPAHRVEVSVDDESGEIAVTGVVDDARFLFHKLRLTSTIRTLPGEQGFRIHDEVTNFGAVATEAEMLYHVNFGPPVLERGAQLVAPVATVVPRTAEAAAAIDQRSVYAAPQAGFAEQVYFYKLLADPAGDTGVLLKNAAGTKGVSLRFNANQLPCFSQWKNTAAVEDGYVTGLEPGANFPNPRSFEAEQGRVVPLAAGESCFFDLALVWHPHAAQVAAEEQAISALQTTVEPTVHTSPQSGWCGP